MIRDIILAAVEAIVIGTFIAAIGVWSLLVTSHLPPVLP